ncbi:1058_t:CDS:2, partial [Scutellospora calospora]
YDKVETIIQNIISNNIIAKQVSLYLLQIMILLPKFPLVIIELVSNNSNKTLMHILQIHKKVLEIASQLLIHIIFIGADSAISEFNTQK